eukprot:TRINITY_DN7647_c0_g2_i2.p1 TRINITY_DN7647_c0_g2~~TRINITY_DN7647_c0_g2_i2.p1  ORF type:complete len:409 (+),score=26.50 TRINITY_DN7647_c0_g2_i2:87-1229(+)
MKINIVELLNQKNIQFEQVHFELGQSDTDKEINIDKRETGTIAVLMVNKQAHLAIVSGNYSLHWEQLKSALQAQQLSIATDNISSGVTSIADIDRILIDRNLCGQIEEIFLKTQSKQTFLKVKTCDILSNFKEGEGCNILDMKLFSKHKAKNIFIAPISAQEKLDFKGPHNQCIFGISLGGNRNYSRSKILAQLDWITKYFARCTVLIIDSSHRFNLTSQDVTEQEALDLALELGQKFLDDHKSTTFQRYENRCEFKFVLGSEVQKLVDYNKFYLQLKQFYLSDANFRSSLNTFNNSYLQKNNFKLSEQQLHEKIICCNEYIFEEFAIFGCVQKEIQSSPCFFVYPGDFKILTEISDGKHPGILKELQNLAIIQLKITKN